VRIAVVGGAGGMGRVAAADAAESDGVAEVRIVDRNPEAAERVAAAIGSPRISVQIVEGGGQAAFADALGGADAVVNAATHRLNLVVMEACLDVGAHYTDLGGLYHWAVRQYELDERYRAAGLSAAISMGSAPGLTNMLAAAACERLDTVESIELVDAIIPGRAGSPGEPYVPPYAPDTLVDEFTEPAAVFLDGKIEFRPAGSGAKLYSLPEGDVECVYTIHSEPATLPRSYAAKGIRNVEWRLGLPPLDVARLLAFVSAGLASRDTVTAGGVETAPRDVLVATLQRQQALHAAVTAGDGVERLRAHVVGTVAGEQVAVDAEMLVTRPADRDVDAGTYATGVPPSIAAQMLVRGDRAGSGVAGPEAMLPVGVFFGELERRGLRAEVSAPRPLR